MVYMNRDLQIFALCSIYLRSSPDHSSRYLKVSTRWREKNGYRVGISKYQVTDRSRMSQSHDS
jgi:hypothetical protein